MSKKLPYQTSVGSKEARLRGPSGPLAVLRFLPRLEASARAQPWRPCRRSISPSLAKLQTLPSLPAAMPPAPGPRRSDRSGAALQATSRRRPRKPGNGRVDSAGRARSTRARIACLAATAVATHLRWQTPFRLRRGQRLVQVVDGASSAVSATSTRARPWSGLAPMAEAIGAGSATRCGG